MQDKRKYKRHSKAFDVRYSCAKGPLIIEGNSKSKDISAGGIRLNLDDELKTSDRVRLSIALPWKKHPLDAIARVVWTSPRPITGSTTMSRDCGLEFAWISYPAAEEAIARA